MYSETSLSGHLFNKTTSLYWPPLVDPKYSYAVLYDLIHKATLLFRPNFLVPQLAILMRFHCTYVNFIFRNFSSGQYEALLTGPYIMW